MVKNLHRTNHMASRNQLLIMNLIKILSFCYPRLRSQTLSFVRSRRKFFVRRENFLSARKFFGDANIFEKLDRVDAIDFVKKSSKLEPSSRFFEPCPAWNARNVLPGTQEMSCLGQHRSQKYNIARNHGIMGLKISSSKNDKF